MKLLLHSCFNQLCRTVSYNFSFVGNAAIFSPEEGDRMFLRNVSIYLRVYMVSQSRKKRPLLPWEPLISCFLSARNYLKMTDFWDVQPCWSSWWRRQYAPLKCLSTPRLHGATSQKALVFILDAVRSRNLTINYLYELRNQFYAAGFLVYDLPKSCVFYKMFHFHKFFEGKAADFIGNRICPHSRHFVYWWRSFYPQSANAWWPGPKRRLWPIAKYRRQKTKPLQKQIRMETV
jgi:hypothetical protein